MQPFFHDAAWHLPPELILKAPAHREWAAEGSGSPRDAAYNLNSWTNQGRTSGGWCWVIIFTQMGKHTTWCGKTHGFRNKTTNSRFSTSSMLVFIFRGIFWQSNKTLLMIRKFKKNMKNQNTMFIITIIIIIIKKWPATQENTSRSRAEQGP